MIISDPRERLWASEAATYMDLSRSTLAKWRASGEGPPYHRCGRRLIYYFKSEIDAWLESCGGSPAGA